MSITNFPSCLSPKTISVVVTLLMFCQTANAERVNFNRDIRPLLNNHCAGCHGGVKQNGGVSVLSRQRLLSESDSGEAPVVPGDADSVMLRRITATDPSERMPPEGHDALTTKEISLLQQWVKEGVDWPVHWSYRPLPSLKKWDFQGQHPIDWFVRRKLAQQKIQPSPPADAMTLVRRLSMDLTGLQPAPAAIDHLVDSPEPFAADSAELATMIDTYLATPQFGERWARHWLDEARYADSEGYEKDSVKEDAWRFRDWVINAINADMPFDDFTRKQLAGDLLPDPSNEDLIATKFHLQTQFNLEGGVDSEEDRTKRVIDRVGTLGAVWMGASMACCQCHDHPYDAYRQQDFYRLYAFFNNSEMATTFLDGEPKDAKKWGEREKKWNALTELLEKQLTDKNLSDRTQAALSQLRTLDNNAGVTRYLRERQSSPRKTYVFTRGDFQRPMIDAGEVAANVPEMFGAIPKASDSASRLDLANWLVNPDNPLTPRVTVNKVWMYLFGRPLAEQPQEFGSRGSEATHPDLLDYLARWFVTDGKWSRKQLIRFIVSSQTYQQSSKTRPDLNAIDPDNHLLARQNRFRVEAEIVRDLNLQAAGLLSSKVGGKSVFPPLPKIIAEQTYAGSNKYKASTGEDRYRRGMYTFFRRTAIDPNLSTFDCPDSSMTRSKRDRSNNPLQALTTLHNEVFHEAAQAFAKRVLESGSPEDVVENRLQNAFLITVSRNASATEVQSLKELLSTSREYYGAHPKEAILIVGSHAAANTAIEENAAWVNVARVILNIDEFLTRS